MKLKAICICVLAALMLPLGACTFKFEHTEPRPEEYAVDYLEEVKKFHIYTPDMKYYGYSAGIVPPKSIDYQGFYASLEGTTDEGTIDLLKDDSFVAGEWFVISDRTIYSSLILTVGYSIDGVTYAERQVDMLTGKDISLKAYGHDFPIETT